VDADTSHPISPEYMCHTNLDIKNVEGYKRFAGIDGALTRRVVTLSQGYMNFELPDGFGFPFLSNEPLHFGSQVLNLNDTVISKNVSQRLRITYVRDQDLKKPLVAVYPTGIYSLISVDGKGSQYGKSQKSEEHGSSCLVGEPAGRVFADQFGAKFSGHWVVPKGRQITRTDVGKVMNLAQDTTVHYIAVPVHPFARSLELRDKTTNDVIFKSNVKNRRQGMGIKTVTYFTSKKGVLLYKDHDYELISTYDNTSLKDQDEMAVFYMFLKNPNYKTD